MTHPTLTASRVVIKTVHNFQAQPSTMSEDNTATQSSFPSSISRPSHVSVSAITDPPFPTDIITDTSIPSTSSTTSSDELPTTTDAAMTTPTTSSSATSSESTAPSSATPTTVAAAAARPALTKPQIAGVAVGSVAAAGLVFGLLALFFCLRDRKRKRRGSDTSFGNDKIVIDEPRGPSPPPPSGRVFQDLEYGPVGAAEPPHAQAGIARPPSNRWSLRRKGVKPEDIGVAVARSPLTQATPPVTPMSAASYETTSRLLPDKPTYSLYPSPLRLSSYNQDVSPIEAPGPATAGFGRALPGVVPKPVPRGHGTMDTSQTDLHLDHPALRPMPSDPFLDASSKNRPTDPRQFHTLPAQRPRAAPPKPVSVHYGQRAKPAGIQRKPVPVPARSPLDNLQVDRSIERLDWGLEAPLQATAPAAELPVVLSEPRPTRRKSSSKRKFHGKRPMTFLSTSDTSFEDADSDEEPPLPQTPLISVVESPPSRPRGPGVRYPVIPTSAAESPSINRSIREVRRGQIEFSPASDRSKGKAKARPGTPSPTDKPLPDVPQLGSAELRERQQVPDSSSDRVKPGSAKHTILVAPGLEGIENVGTPKSKKSVEWTPLSTPTRRGR
ncbi:MAG: hypothetical protein LQ338_004956 [Usnochroma carphineum]|nr:MAG: hypothetical protein LQ338_004956 [Usnochroma carphineum]